MADQPSTCSGVTVPSGITLTSPRLVATTAAPSPGRTAMAGCASLMPAATSVRRPWQSSSSTAAPSPRRTSTSSESPKRPAVSKAPDSTVPSGMLLRHGATLPWASRVASDSLPPFLAGMPTTRSLGRNPQLCAAAGTGASATMCGRTPWSLRVCIAAPAKGYVPPCGSTSRSASPTWAMASPSVRMATTSPSDATLSTRASGATSAACTVLHAATAHVASTAVRREIGCMGAEGRR